MANVGTSYASGTVNYDGVSPGRNFATGGGGSGSNGNVIMLTGITNDGTSPSIDINNVNTDGGTGGGGNVTLANPTPGLTSGGITITNGAITSGSIIGVGTPRRFFFDIY